MSSLDTIQGALSHHGLELGKAEARDLYSRGLDVQNLGGFPVLETIARAVDEYGAPKTDAHVLDVACGRAGRGAAS